MAHLAFRTEFSWDRVDGDRRICTTCTTMDNMHKAAGQGQSSRPALDLAHLLHCHAQLSDRFAGAGIVIGRRTLVCTHWGEAFSYGVSAH